MHIAFLRIFFLFQYDNLFCILQGLLFMFDEGLVSTIICKKHVLLLQGPVGPFFLFLKKHLEKKGIHVTKVNFNGGDLCFYPFHSVWFRGELSVWSDTLKKIILEKKIEQIVVFGDCRPIHCVARKITSQLDIEFVVFEEGYVRPDYITLERNGVNGRSQIPLSRSFYDSLSLGKENIEKISLGNTYYYSVLWAMIYYFFGILLSPVFKYYQHHRPLGCLEMFRWIRGIYRYVWYKLKEKHVQRYLTDNLNKKFYLVALQVHNDAQIVYYSDYKCVENFIEEVICSFTQNAAPDMSLVIKHHPQDRAYKDYTKLIACLVDQFKLNGRVYYIHDQHLPSLLSSALGVVVINSTVGLSSLFHNTLVKTMGMAVYNIDGLTYQGCLDTFFSACKKEVIDRVLYRKFIYYLISTTQINGSYYKKINELSGLQLPRKVIFPFEDKESVYE